MQQCDGNENVTEKVNLRSFCLNSNYSYSLTLSNVGKPYWSLISRDYNQTQTEKQNFIVACLCSPYNTKLGIFTSQSCKTGKKCTTKHDARAKLLFCLLNQLFFLTFWLPSVSLNLKLPSKGPTPVNALSPRVLHVATFMPLPSTALYEFFYPNSHHLNCHTGKFIFHCLSLTLLNSGSPVNMRGC